MLRSIPWVLTAVLYSPILFQLYRSRWETIDYTHAYFILPVSLWIVWLKRDSLKTLVKTPSGHSFSALFFFMLGVLMFIFGWRQDYLVISTFSLIPFLFGLSAYLYGKNVSKALWFPVLYLLLMVPPPLGVLDSITMPMRYGVTVAAYGFLKTLGYPILRDGLLLSVGGHEIYMGPACSGFRSLITMISLGLAYIYITKGSLKKKAVLLASIVPLALLGNFVRVIGVCMATYHFGDAAGEKFHDISGFVIFAILVLGLLGLENLCEKLKW